MRSVESGPSIPGVFRLRQSLATAKCAVLGDEGMGDVAGCYRRPKRGPKASHGVHSHYMASSAHALHCFYSVHPVERLALEARDTHTQS